MAEQTTTPDAAEQTEAAAPVTERQIAFIFGELQALGAKGATAKELKTATGMRAGVVRGCLEALVAAGTIIDAKGSRGEYQVRTPAQVAKAQAREQFRVALCRALGVDTESGDMNASGVNVAIARADVVHKLLSVDPDQLGWLQETCNLYGKACVVVAAEQRAAQPPAESPSSAAMTNSETPPPSAAAGAPRKRGRGGPQSQASA